MNRSLVVRMVFLLTMMMAGGGGGSVESVGRGWGVLGACQRAKEAGGEIQRTVHFI